MRIWESEHGLMTDEQLLKYIAAYGDLKEALAAGNVRLLSNETDVWKPQRETAGNKRLKLQDFMEQE